MPGFPDSAQVVTSAPDGTDVRWLGRIGHFTQLVYSYTLPGGPDQMTGVLQLPPTAREKAIDAGRTAGVYRGGVRVWDGKLDEAVAGNNGWTISAHGAGTYGTDFAAYYATWNANDPVNQAIGRGLRWVNPGISSGQVFLGTQPDPAANTVTDHLNNITTTAGSVWYVNSGAGNVLSVYTPAWTTANRILIATSPVPRNLYGYPTVIWGRYQATADSTTGTGAAATFGTTSVTNAANAARHGNMEVYIDLSPVGVMSAGAAQGILSSVLAKYTAASFGGSFTVRRGQLLTMGGTAVDLGADQAGTVCQLMFAAGGYGGEVVPALPVTFTVGAYSYDDTLQMATVTPYQAADFSLSGLLSTWVTLNTPAATTVA